MPSIEIDILAATLNIRNVTSMRVNAMCALNGSIHRKIFLATAKINSNRIVRLTQGVRAERLQQGRTSLAPTLLSAVTAAAAVVSAIRNVTRKSGALYSYKKERNRYSPVINVRTMKNI